MAFALWCWAAMLLTHELGHVLAAWLTGGRVTYVNVYPGVISSTLVQPNPMPSVVLWGGFVSGWLAPQVVSLAFFRSRFSHAAACWAGFCWLAGGVYLAVGGLERFTDTSQLAREGWPLWLLTPIGVGAAILGYTICRRAWPKLIRQLETSSTTWRRIALTWAALGLWCSLQWGLAMVLDVTTS